MSHNLETLKTEGVSLLPYQPELEATVQEAARSWQKFCEQELSVKQRLETNSQSAGTGYEYKDGSGDHADHKENFDVALSHQKYLNNLRSNATEGSVSQDFVERARSLSIAMAPLAIDFARQAESIYGLMGFEDEVRASSGNIFVRFIHYFGERAQGDLLAEPHTDQSGFTFHLYETSGGCQRFDYDSKKWKNMPVQAGKTAVIPAMQLQLRSHGELRALTHRVVTNEETKSVGRYAIVCFVRLAQTPMYNKSIAGRLQERAPGFNYGMSHEAFSRLFA